MILWGPCAGSAEYTTIGLALFSIGSATSPFNEISPKRMLSNNSGVSDSNAKLFMLANAMLSIRVIPFAGFS